MIRLFILIYFSSFQYRQFSYTIGHDQILSVNMRNICRFLFFLHDRTNSIDSLTASITKLFSGLNAIENIEDKMTSTNSDSKKVVNLLDYSFLALKINRLQISKAQPSNSLNYKMSMS
jgi:hypothetical protein